MQRPCLLQRHILYAEHKAGPRVGSSICLLRDCLKDSLSPACSTEMGGLLGRQLLNSTNSGWWTEGGYWCRRGCIILSQMAQVSGTSPGIDGGSHKHSKGPWWWGLTICFNAVYNGEVYMGCRLPDPSTDWPRGSRGSTLHVTGYPHKLCDLSDSGNLYKLHLLVINGTHQASHNTLDLIEWMHIVWPSYAWLL